jgi:AraC-like DNA-binding protein
MSDQLSVVLENFSLSAGVFYSGKLCGIFDYGNSNVAEGHIHIVREGTLKIAQKHKDTVVVNEPSVVFFPRPQAHTLKAEMTDDTRVVCANVRYGVGMNNPLSQTLPPCIVLPLSRIPEIQFCVEGMLHESANSTKPGSQQIMNRYMEIFLVSVLRHLMESEQVHTGVLSGLANPALSKAITAMHTNPANRWSLQLLAETACQSRSKFADDFKRTVGVPALEYLTHWRIGVGKSLLLRGKQIGFVASEVGYESASSFTKAFKKIEGCSPKAWLTDELAA